MLVIKSTSLLLWAAMSMALQFWNNWINPYDDSHHNHSILDASKYHEPPPLGERASDAIEWSREKASEAVDWSKEKAAGAVNWTRAKAHDAIDWTSNQTYGTGTAQDAFKKLRHRLTGISSTANFAGTGEISPSSTPGYQIRVQPHEYVVFLNMAGIPLNSMHAQVAQGQLMLWGEHEQCAGRACWERSVEEIFDLPEDALPEQIEAHVDMHILTVHVPRRSILGEREVPIAQRGTVEKILHKVGLE